MIGRTGILKRTYDSVALVALLNVVGVAALVGFLVNSGGLNREKLAGMVRVARGEGVVIDPEALAGEPAETAEDATADESASIVSQDDVEVLRLEARRIKTELDQRLALNNSILLKVMTEREAFRREREQAAKQQAAMESQRDETGFKKQIAIYEGLPARMAVQHLLDMNNPDEAARILVELSTNQAKKIVKAAKRGEQMKKMEEILRRVRDVAPIQAGQIESDD